MWFERWEPRIQELVRPLSSSRDRSFQDELVQAVRNKLWAHLSEGRLDAERDLAPWLKRVIRTTSIDLHKADVRRRDKVSTSEPSADAAEELSSTATGGDPESQLLREQLRCLVHRGLGALRPEHRVLLVRHDLEGCSFVEMAAELGVKESTLAARHKRAMEELRKAMKRLGLPVTPLVLRWLLDLETREVTRRDASAPPAAPSGVAARLAGHFREALAVASVCAGLAAVPSFPGSFVSAPPAPPADGIPALATAWVPGGGVEGSESPVPTPPVPPGAPYPETFGGGLQGGENRPGLQSGGPSPPDGGGDTSGGRVSPGKSRPAAAPAKAIQGGGSSGRVGSTASLRSPDGTPSLLRVNPQIGAGSSEDDAREPGGVSGAVTEEGALQPKGETKADPPAPSVDDAQDASTLMEEEAAELGTLPVMTGLPGDGTGPAPVDDPIDPAPVDPGGGSGSGGGASSGCAAPPGPPELVAVGAPGSLLLRGCIVTPEGAFDGEVLIQGDTLSCVGATCLSEPGAATASIVHTHGIVLPGLIDANNHILYDIFDESDWAPQQSYTNRNQWVKDPRYKALVDAKQFLNGEGDPSLQPGVGCEMNKYGELKGLIAGTTSIVGAANPVNKACYGSLARTVDQTPNDLGQDKIQIRTTFPPKEVDAASICENFASGTTDAWLVHCGQGTDDAARSQLATLSSLASGCLLAKQTTIVHGIAFGEAELTTMAAHGMSLVWSPRSNITLYGGGTDLSRTANVPLALDLGITVALGADWSLTGSQNLLDELRKADQVDNERWGNRLTSRDLVEMATIRAARVLGLEHLIGSLETGKKADVLVIGGDPAHPWDAVLDAGPADVRLVMVNGVPLYGDVPLQPVAPAAPGCEALDICGEAKFVCVAEAGGTASNKLGQSLAEISGILETEMEAYDALELTPWTFAPIAPLVKCP